MKTNTKQVAKPVPVKPKIREERDFKILQELKWLQKYRYSINLRYQNFKDALQNIENIYGSIDNFTDSYKYYGLHHRDNAIYYKEWAPNATAIYLAGDFNNWNVTDPKTKCDRDCFGCFSLCLPDNEDGTPVIPHNTKVRCFLELQTGERLSRVPAWINYTYQNPNDYNFDGVFWNPPEKYVFKNPWPEPRTNSAFMIYESHIGMAGPEERVHTYNEFTENVLPYVKEHGFNAIQLMGVMEHAYYASAGYQVTSFFAPSYRYGTPDDLKRLIDTAHSLGIYVFLDTVHSHAAANVLEGINQFDGTQTMYFHDGERGHHPVWKSRLFNYSNIEVQRFLLSNLKYWSQEFHFDGFRFDGVTSMIYLNHGLNVNFFDIDNYFGDNVDEEAVTYLYLANYVIHKYDMYAITIAEDVSGMTGMARTIEDGGFGFDFRLAMGIPDVWITTLKTAKTDYDWNIDKISHAILNRPAGEKTVSYCESHDQALVGDKTIAFWLMDQEMYSHMSVFSPQSDVIDRGIALHKMIRFLTFALGGEAYLTFMGNEFGHPEWVDFPGISNQDSFKYCVRKYNLAKDTCLKYKYLINFDDGMKALEKKYTFLNCGDNGRITLVHNQHMIVAFERSNILFVFNFHPSNSYTDYYLPVEWPGKFEYVLCTDDEEYGGFKRIDTTTTPFSFKEDYMGRQCKIQLYLPSRCAFALRLIDEKK
ncbi:1,4-alpha-glucan branching enzyme IIB, precursor [Tritrichomonas foetus]|uniref:1,4-alpha-glucan branching enzyme n=1 Tax=Tritrichomonas foetus TaxID=1144522 RepID=A0A1J4JKY4_9EUKA|nr:1,4-alpha-glucan branching enzyme IIB, precursor [Tritrichomonas foetus]|eukprot:OHS99321.1 1,4-alpha-glucan branching enzyme IIB, precursor [Tritrichomonas foetus]